MSKVKTDNLESYTTNGVLNMLSDVVLASGKGITVPGATDLDGGLTVDGSGDSATVATGDVFVGTGTLKVGGTTSSPNATINTNVPQHSRLSQLAVSRCQPPALAAARRV